LDEFISLESKVLRGDNADAIHDIRVASRRLQQVLDLMYPKPRQPKLRKLRRTIRRSRRALSTVRNCDVLLERVEKTLERRKLANREVWNAFHDYLKDLRDSSLRKALRRWSGLNLPAFYVHLKGFLEDTEASPAQARRGSAISNSPSAAPGSTLQTRIGDALQETWSDLASRVEQAREQTTAPALHGVRIAAKRVRYLIEVIHELGSGDAEQALACLRQLQQHLGEWHDLVVMEEAMLEMLSRPRFLQKRLELALETCRVVLRSRSHQRRYEGKFVEMVAGSPEWASLESWVSRFLGSSATTSTPMEGSASA
jgi:CHAD domain-containing protein